MRIIHGDGLDGEGRSIPQLNEIFSCLLHKMLGDGDVQRVNDGRVAFVSCGRIFSSISSRCSSRTTWHSTRTPRRRASSTPGARLIVALVVLVPDQELSRVGSAHEHF